MLAGMSRIEPPIVSKLVGEGGGRHQSRRGVALQKEGYMILRVGVVVDSSTVVIVVVIVVRSSRRRQTSK